ncbi:glycosyltransferase family 2 protein [Fundidesulfovibrio terrae]|uniref:glycosyltransferase family 2 protein n=1 Tax=Fundidesulfovibrio terrae TaxID=2922866 RepID=UPI001FAE8A12|nr:glycosyltransferase [Fundidesulfovibrio terrae]
MRAPDFDWEGLPAALRHGLVLGGVGKPHLAELARLALESPATARLGLDILLAAWEAGPLDGGLAGLLAGLDARARFLDPRVRAAVDACAGNWRAPDQPGDSGVVAAMAQMAARRAHGELLALLMDRFREDPGNLFWRQHLLDLAYLLGHREAAGRCLDAPWPSGLKAVRDKCRGDVLFQGGDFEQAARSYGAARLLRPARARLGQCFFRLGRLAEAAGQWRAAASQAPWNANLILRLYDRLAGHDLPDDPLPGRVVVCLYTSGKAREVDETLAALFASELGGARVVVLDNGSSDGTAQALAAWKDRAGERLEVVCLPVNVGAPAARNWLMRHPAVAGSDFTAYLDDDALVPPDWARLLGRAVSSYPDAGVWGCKVVDLAQTGRIQSADINLLEDADGLPAFSSLCSQDLDFGQFDAVRPCLSVTGCFHLFRTPVLMECGDFDIRFSPTQYDDLDHDLRLWGMGRAAVCQGHLAVRHARLSGSLLRQDPQATANSEANLKKLAAKHPPEERRRLREAVQTALLGDLRAKTAALADG